MACQCTKPEIYYFCDECEEFHHHDEIEEECDTSKYCLIESKDIQDVIHAEMLAKAKRLRKNAEELDIIGEYDSMEKDEKEASKIEDEIIECLRGEP